MTPKLLETMEECFLGVPRIDRVTVRAKSIDRFVKKAEKTNELGPLYTEPMCQIQDQIGCRVVVFYLNDVETVSNLITKYFRAIEEAVKRPDKDEQFGYFGKHFILPIPREIIPKDVQQDEVPNYFELQIKTLYQHAWAEAEHDVGYKPCEQLSGEQRRSLAFVAAISWGADKAFHELAARLVPGYPLEQ